MRLCEIWKEQCDAALQIEAEFDTEKALDYLIEEKFLSFHEAAENDAEFRAEIPAFVAEIKTSASRRTSLRWRSAPPVRGFWLDGQVGF